MTIEMPDISSLAFVEELWVKYRKDPLQVTSEWRQYFEQLEKSEFHLEGASPSVTLGREQLQRGIDPLGEACDRCGRVPAMAALQHEVGSLMRNYRVRGHRVAKIDPLEGELPHLPELEPEYYGLVESDLDLTFSAGPLSRGEPLTLREIIARLRETYCDSIGVQYMHIDNLAKREWLQQRMESTRNRIALSREQQVRIFTRLTDAVLFEQFIQRKFVGAKSFSLEGAESLIPLLDLAIDKAGSQGVERIAIGMPHRGRLNVLSNIMGKHPRQIFSEFKDSVSEDDSGPSDVKYHLGYHRDLVTTSGNALHMDLLFNPSHLEFVAPVAQGALRAEQDLIADESREKGLLVLIHGDASIAAQGIVQETLNLSRLKGYSVGGALHIVVNNQIGFTTLSTDGRSSTYASDVTRMLPVPVFHVNGEQPEAVAQAVELALDFRAQFKSDVVIDMYCYRRRGHNEGDEPVFTQPLMYKRIKARPTVHEAYERHLLDLGELESAESERVKKDRLEYLEKELESTTKVDEVAYPARPNAYESRWDRYRIGADFVMGGIETAVKAKRLESVLQTICRLPPGFTAHKKIAKFLETRLKMARGEKPLDWGAAEALALATLADDGIGIRLSGQDSQRGTFSHRHAVFHDQENGEQHVPLQHISADQARVEILNSPLSEGAVLGFEYGYSAVNPNALVIWEAQFGDFANAAQVYIDQFITTGETKWKLLSTLVLFLPHGLEGTGPEHASARLERFLSLASENNIQVVSPTTPAQIFHLLRRQARMPVRKPLVVLSPKSMLRHPQVVSSMEELATGSFQEILADPEVPLERAERAILCNGKIYYDMLAERKAEGRDDVAIIRIEQLYPLLTEWIEEVLNGLPDGQPVVWVQEEPRNMGAYTHIRLHHADRLAKRWPIYCACRPAASSPATGSAAIHKIEQRRLIEQAFGDPEVSLELMARRNP